MRRRVYSAAYGEHPALARKGRDVEVELASILFSWLLHLDPACIVCNSDGTPWTGYAGAAGAAGGGLGLNDLFGQDVGGTAVGDTSPDYSGRSRLGDPVNPFTQPGEFVPSPSGTDGFGSPNTDPSGDDRVAAEEAARQRAYDHYRRTHPNATTAPPPEPTYNEQAADFFNRSMRNIGR